MSYTLSHTVVDGYKIAGFVGVEAYGGVGLITAVVEVFAGVAVCKRD